MSAFDSPITCTGTIFIPFVHPLKGYLIAQNRQGMLKPKTTRVPTYAHTIVPLATQHLGGCTMTWVSREKALF